MKAAGGKANPKRVNELLKRALGGVTRPRRTAWLYSTSLLQKNPSG